MRCASAAAAGSITTNWGGHRWHRACIFRLLLIGFFEGIASERGIAWRVADSLSLRRFLSYGLDETTPDHT